MAKAPGDVTNWDGSGTVWFKVVYWRTLENLGACAKITDRYMRSLLSLTVVLQSPGLRLVRAIPCLLNEVVALIFHFQN